MSRRDFAGPVKKGFIRHLDSRGDGTGVTDATGLYADSTVTFTNATNVVNLATHGYVAGDGPFQFSNSGGALPAELAESTDYWVVETVAAGTFQVALTQGGTAVEFTDDGTGTNTIETPFRFYVEAAAGEILRIDGLIVHIQDATGFDASEYGALGAALTTGITVQTLDTAGAVFQNWTNGDPVLTNADWGKFCYENKLQGFGTGDDFFQAWLDFPGPVRLKEGEQLVITCHDDMDGLAAHTFVAHGFDEAQWTHGS